MTERLDAALVARGLSRSRTAARAAVEAGQVRVNGEVCPRPARRVSEADDITTQGGPRYVGRGGVKLEAALRHFGIDPAGKRCLDVGASTGGFTDCLLQHGASEVVSVDVGHDQMDSTLRAHPRVRVHEGVNIRETPPAPWSGTFELIAVDVSFISLRLVLPSLAAWAGPDAVVVLLVKPQFECGRAALSKNGVVRDPAERTRAVDAVRTAVADSTDWKVLGVIPSPIAGGSGNEEFLLAAGTGKHGAVLSGLASPGGSDKLSA